MSELKNKLWAQADTCKDELISALLDAAADRIEKLENFQRHSIDDLRAYSDRLDMLEKDRDKWKGHAKRLFGDICDE